MKSIILLLLMNSLCQFSFSQIRATTSSGKKVILNMDGTWKYADNTAIQQKPCAENHTGNLTVKNNTDNDIYFYYSNSGEYSTSTQFVKIKSKSTKSINNLPLSYESYGSPIKYDYVWKATNETQRNGEAIQRMEGIENGKFTLVECDETEIEIGN
jgi:hypothetical protein